MAGPVNYTESEIRAALVARFGPLVEGEVTAEELADTALRALKEDLGMYFKKGNWPGYQMPASGLSLG